MEETPQETVARCVKRLGELLAPIFNAPRRPDETIWGFGAIDVCAHVYMPQGEPSISPAELADLMDMSVDTRRRILKRSPHRAAEKNPGCAQCSIERHIKRRIEPLHWRLN